MPELKDVLPNLTEDAAHRDTAAYKLRNQRVAAIKLTSGEPCSSRSELFAPWPGPEQNIEEWYLLDNGQAVGKGRDCQGMPVYPVLILNIARD